MEQYKVKPHRVLLFIPERFYTKYEPKWHELDMVGYVCIMHGTLQSEATESAAFHPRAILHQVRT